MHAFNDFKKARRLLKRFHKMTSKNALIITDTRNPHHTKNPDHLAYHEFNRKRNRMSGQNRIRVRVQKHVTKWFDYLIASKEEMKEILKGTGWMVKEFIDSEDSIYTAIIEKERV